MDCYCCSLFGFLFGLMGIAWTHFGKLVSLVFYWVQHLNALYGISFILIFILKLDSQDFFPLSA